MDKICVCRMNIKGSILQYKKNLNKIPLPYTILRFKNDIFISISVDILGNMKNGEYIKFMNELLADIHEENNHSGIIFDIYDRIPIFFTRSKDIEDARGFTYDEFDDFHVYSKTLDDFLDMEKKDFVDIIKTHHDVLFNVSCIVK